MNPPYRKLGSDSAERSRLSTAGIETSNLYSAFVWLALKLLAGGGELVAITPRSFMNGSCFRPFRQALSQELAFRRIHVYDARDAAFADDGVLQENVIFHGVQGAGPEAIRITTSLGPADDGLLERTVEPDELILPHNPDHVLHVVPDEADAKIGAHMCGVTGRTNGTGRSRRIRHPSRGAADWWRSVGVVRSGRPVRRSNERGGAASCGTPGSSCRRSLVHPGSSRRGTKRDHPHSQNQEMPRRGGARRFRRLRPDRRGGATPGAPAEHGLRRLRRRRDDRLRRGQPAALRSLGRRLCRRRLPRHAAQGGSLGPAAHGDLPLVVSGRGGPFGRPAGRAALALAGALRPAREDGRLLLQGRDVRDPRAALIGPVPGYPRASAFQGWGHPRGAVRQRRAGGVRSHREALFRRAPRRVSRRAAGIGAGWIPRRHPVPRARGQLQPVEFPRRVPGLARLRRRRPELHLRQCNPARAARPRLRVRPPGLGR